MTMGEFKRQLKASQEWEDDLTKRLTMVDLLMGDTQLIDDDHTVMQAGLSEDVALDVLFRVIRMYCITSSFSCIRISVQ